ncbi:MAG: hypothetical protein HY770_07280, partial [Chitinivibrionia bacterium]|nr:hypothetical protein [Chitinivibrionia bacterium]
VCCRTAPWIQEFIKHPFKRIDKPLAEGLLLTDDKPMIDVLNAESIKFFRMKAIEAYGNKLLNSGQGLFR